MGNFIENLNTFQQGILRVETHQILNLQSDIFCATSVVYLNHRALKHKVVNWGGVSGVAGIEQITFHKTAHHFTFLKVHDLSCNNTKFHDKQNLDSKVCQFMTYESKLYHTRTNKLSENYLKTEHNFPNVILNITFCYLQNKSFYLLNVLCALAFYASFTC